MATLGTMTVGDTTLTLTDIAVRDGHLWFCATGKVTVDVDVADGDTVTVYDRDGVAVGSWPHITYKNPLTARAGESLTVRLPINIRGVSS